ncbi:2Fe-2S iron-sulfur cluster-binding protein [Streptomyces sp. NPDC020917]|uniref:2Fe-2S iron-sulfur cluster-binding protein n=1 Tax=Streptomyces sp. NPDC020917 TaxID=3365102 RepID=UPI0037A212EB
MTDQSHPGSEGHGNSGAWQPVPGGGDYDPDQTMHVSFAAQLPPEPRPGEDPLSAHGPTGPGPRAGDPATTWTIPVIRDEPEPDSGEYSVGAFTSSWDQAPSPAASTTQSFPAGMFGQGAAAAQAARASAAGAADAAETGPAAAEQPPGSPGTGQWAMPFSGPQAGEAAPWQPAHAPAADAAWTGPAGDPEQAAGDAPPYGHPRDEHGATGLPPAQAGYTPGAAPAGYGTGLPGTDGRGTAYAGGGTDGLDAHGSSYGRPGQGGPGADGIPFGSPGADGTAYGAVASDGRGRAYAPAASDGRGTAYDVDGADAHGTSYGAVASDGRGTVYAPAASDGRGTAYDVDGADAHGTSYGAAASDGRGTVYAPAASDGRGTAYDVDGADAHGTSYSAGGSDGRGAVDASGGAGADGAGYGPGGPAGGEDGHAYAASDAASGGEGFGAEEPSGTAVPQPQPQPQPLPEAEPRPDATAGDAPAEHDQNPDSADAADPADAPDADGTGAAALPEKDPADDALPGAESAEEAEPEPEPEPVEESRSEHPLASYTLRVNGTERPVTDAWLGESLLYVLRERLGLAGAKDGCEQGECGACSVKVDGRLVASCLVPAATAAGAEVRTVEGLAVDGRPSDVQQALADCGAVQCGFCIPGMAMTVHDLLEGNHRPTDLEVRQALSGNLCRCSGYRGMLDAVRQVVADRAAEDDAGAAEDAVRVPHQGGPAAPEGAR